MIQKIALMGCILSVSVASLFILVQIYTDHAGEKYCPLIGTHNLTGREGLTPVYVCCFTREDTFQLECRKYSLFDKTPHKTTGHLHYKDSRNSIVNVSGLEFNYTPTNLAKINYSRY